MTDNQCLICGEEFMRNIGHRCTASKPPRICWQEPAGLFSRIVFYLATHCQVKFSMFEKEKGKEKIKTGEIWRSPTF